MNLKMNFSEGLNMPTNILKKESRGGKLIEEGYIFILALLIG